MVQDRPTFCLTGAGTPAGSVLGPCWLHLEPRQVHASGVERTFSVGVLQTSWAHARLYFCFVFLLACSRFKFKFLPVRDCPNSDFLLACNLLNLDLLHACNCFYFCFYKATPTPTLCLLAACWLHAGCMLAVCWLHVGCMLAACWVRAGCMLVVCWVHAKCMPAPCQLHAGMLAGQVLEAC